MSKEYKSGINKDGFRIPPLPSEELDENEDIGMLDHMSAFMTKFPTTQELDFTHQVDTNLKNLDTLAIETKNWDKYFAKSEAINIENDYFQVYSIPQTEKLNKPLTFICHHGAGHSGLSFSLMAKALHEQLNGECTIIAYDARAHGLTKNNNDKLSLENLANDLEILIQKIVPEGEIILVGHSMGGAVVAEGASSKRGGQLGGKIIAGLVVIDVVEGTALAALSSMNLVLDSRPKSFKTPEEAIKWSLRSRTLKNLQSAEISIPSQIVKDNENYVWRTDLAGSQPYWEGWYKGLSQKFLDAPTPKLLILAGTDRLDKELTIGQMQGKFQLEVRPATSHVVQEDDPEGVAKLLANFAIRYHKPIPRSFLKS